MGKKKSNLDHICWIEMMVKLWTSKGDGLEHWMQWSIFMPFKLAGAIWWLFLTIFASLLPLSTSTVDGKIAIFSIQQNRVAAGLMQKRWEREAFVQMDAKLT